jgi:peptidoglycan/LPS O-acetylase OafA/YrhL
MSQKFHALTGYRGIAALLIVFYHNGFKKDQLGSFLFAIQENLNIGVPLFFVLSGFLIIYRYYHQMQLSWGWFRSYLRNRFARIYPVYFAYCLVLALWFRDWDFSTWLIHLTMATGLAREDVVRLPQAWSLTVEEMFYLCAPLLILALRRQKYLLAYAASVSVALFSIILFYHFPPLPEVLNLGDPYTILRNTFFGRSTEFFLGGALAYAALSGKISLTRQESVSYRYTLLGITGIVVILVVLALVKLNMPAGDFQRYVRFCLRALVMPWATLVLIYGLCRENNVVTSFLGSRVMIKLGECSYILYLIHMGPAGGIVHQRLGLGPVPGTLIIILLSWGIYEIWERPMNQLLRARKVAAIT